MTKFSVGDRVRIYHGYHFDEGTVERIDAHGILHVTKSGVDDVAFHPKQCRKLVKKERRRIWVRWNTMPLEGDVLGTTCVSRMDRSDLGWTEFVEVRKKK